MSGASAYLVGRTQTRWADATPQVQDALFAAERLDSASITERSFTHCTFANVSFLNCHIVGTKFTNCVFIDCYFKDAVFENTTLTACRFIRCDLRKAKLAGQSDLSVYNHFSDCYLRYDEARYSLGDKPNLRARIARDLGREAERAGDSRDAKRYRQDAAAAWEAHLFAAVRGGNSFYKEHFKGGRRLLALSAWLASRARGYLIGHGASGITFARNFIFLTFLMFPGLLWLCRSGLKAGNGDSDIRPSDYIFTSLDNVLPVAGIGTLSYTSAPARTIAALEVGVGVMLFGIFVGLLLRLVLGGRRGSG